jgi:hypothetical protein
MPQPCTICTHAQRQAIDRALVGDAPNRRIATQYEVSEAAVRRHKAEHLPARMLKAQERTDVRQAIDVVQQLMVINGATLSILKEARDSGKHAIALMAIDRVQKQIELQAKLLGDLQQEGTVNIMVNPQWVTIRAVLFDALAPYPDARAAVASALLEVDQHAGD